MAADIIPRVVGERMAARDDTGEALQKALAEANQAIIKAGQHQPVGRRMGTTAVLAVQAADQVYIASVGDSRAYLVRGKHVEQLTDDHTLADAMERTGNLTHEEALQSPLRNILYKFLGCTEMPDLAEVRPISLQPADRLVLGSDGLTNFVTFDDLRDGVAFSRDPQAWADHLVHLALERGSRDNVTCVVVVFDAQ
jgi:protein phosphatase